MTISKSVIALSVASVVLGGFFLAKPVSAKWGDPAVRGANYSEERHTAMQAAFDGKNYDAWVKLMEDRPIVNSVTRENFAKFVEAHALAVDQKIDQANAIRAEIGLPPIGQRLGTGNGMRRGMGR
ncbi:MAG: hypothetical protein UX04_C0002G0253 [Microgenomates group bacterium GW2011_GWF2_45_18]|nr:MAG: hypothetical protein UW18_C0003G0309 [Microgenomates group bacterium GW2011_GWF1_44_10]KKU02110.1 MAG: hypothetical protein UX04_C0002G0253 [Microgenomates group bacterium GW2011_GWF2_45_18]OGJ41397.1 MAG: hypothetical protein A2378_02980 [Candidatus Pacebacteria bacterium RIFOXYB1_FULL_44_10]HAU98663.1 hypothetical protein [Candidatus Paceibacterota bacterium]HAX01911.1 hypothetical protein [Candidatus Paceibacterota bacterium]